MHARARVAAAACTGLVALLSLGGCGGASDPDAARKAATDFYGALRAGDGQKACSLLTPEEAQSSSGAGGPGASCASTIGQIGAGFPPAGVKSVKVNGDSASVVLSVAANLPITIDLQKQGGKWLVAHYG